MKTVFVTLKGKGPVFWMENLNDDVTPYDVDLSMSLSESVFKTSATFP